MSLQTMDRRFRRSWSVAFLVENQAAMFAAYMNILWWRLSGCPSGTRIAARQIGPA